MQALSAPAMAASVRPTGGAQRPFPGDDGEGLGDDPDRAAQHAEADGEIGDLLQLAGAEFQIGQDPAVDPAHHQEGEELDQGHQYAADGFGGDGEGAPDHPHHPEKAQDEPIRHQGEAQRAFLRLLLGRDR